MYRINTVAIVASHSQLPLWFIDVFKYMFLIVFNKTAEVGCTLQMQLQPWQRELGAMYGNMFWNRLFGLQIAKTCNWWRLQGGLKITWSQNCSNYCRPGWARRCPFLHSQIKWKDSCSYDNILPQVPAQVLGREKNATWTLVKLTRAMNGKSGE